MTDPVGVTQDPRPVLMMGDEPEDEADAERFRWLAERGVLGFEAAPGWRYVVSFEAGGCDANTLRGAIDEAIRAAA